MICCLSRKMIAESNDSVSHLSITARDSNKNWKLKSNTAASMMKRSQCISAQL